MIRRFIRWLFPATAETVGRRKGERRMRIAEERWAAEDRFVKELARQQREKEGK